MRESVAHAKLSVHLIGASYGIIPDGEEERSNVRLQNEIAAERSGDPAFKRLIMPDEFQFMPEPTRFSSCLRALRGR